MIAGVLSTEQSGYYRFFGQAEIKMTEFNIKLAGFPIRVHAIHESTKNFCHDYLTDEPSETVLTITQEEIDRTRRESVAGDIFEGREPVSHRDRYLETLTLLRMAADALLDHGVLLFHGSVTAVDGKAYLFTAKSGTGKTTHSGLWLKNIPGAYILNGDKPFLLFKDDGIFACGNPWQGKENYGRNEILPLAAICILERDETNHIEPVTFKEAFEVLAFQSHKPPQDGRMVSYINLLGRICSLPLYRLGCNMDDEAAFVSYRGMVTS